MAEQGLTVTKAGDVSVVAFASTMVLDISTSEAMARDLLRLADSPPPPRILVDFTSVRFLASRMLGLLVELSRKAEAGGGKVIICGLQGDVNRVFRVMQLDRLLTVVTDRDTAIAAFVQA